MKEAISLQPWRGSLGEGREDQEQGSAEEPNKSEPRLTPHDGNKKLCSPRQKSASSPHSAPQRGCRRFSMISLQAHQTIVGKRRPLASALRRWILAGRQVFSNGERSLQLIHL